MEIAFFWILFSIVVGVAANARGRDGIGVVCSRVDYIAAGCVVAGARNAEARIARRARHSAAPVYGFKSSRD